MKKVLLSTLAACIMLTMLSACTKGYESQKSAGDLKVTLSVERYPLIKGDNLLAVKVTDASGKPVTDAVVNARYYMPPMPGMAPMDFSTSAVLKGDGYVFSANVPMEGGWKTDITVTVANKPAVNASYNLDAR
jgi:hypothetical protein